MTIPSSIYVLSSIFDITYAIIPVVNPATYSNEKSRHAHECNSGITVRLVKVFDLRVAS